MSKKFKVSRRAFLRTAGVGTGAVVFGQYLTPSLQAQGLIHNLLNGFPVDGVPVVALKVNGDVVITTHRPEMGQGIRSSLAAVLADEMEADWKRVTLKQADAEAAKYAVAFPGPVTGPLPFPYEDISKTADPKLQYLIPPEGSQFTDSSRSMTAFYQVMRLYGAGIRLAMVRAAAKKWGVKPEECRAEKHRVYGPAGQSSDYRWLLLGAKKETPTYEEINAALKKPEEFRYIGKGKEPMPFYDAADMVRGKSVYGADVELPGMLTAMIDRCPVANGALVSYDPAPALAVTGVRAVVPMFPPQFRAGGVGRAFMPHAGVAVIATNTWSAWAGRRALRPTITWDLGPHATYDSDKFREELKASTSKPGKVVRKLKDADDAFTHAGAGDTVQAHYYVPHLAQTPMEPPVAVALFQGGRMEVWAPTQNPDGAQQAAGAVALGLTADQMAVPTFQEKARQAATVHLTMLGGGFGRKSKPDYITEACMLARQMPGTPIRVQWTREDDVKFSYYTAASSQYLKASLGANGRPTALLQRSALTSFFGTLFPNSSTPGLSEPEVAAYQKARSEFVGSGVYPYASGIERAQGLEDMPYDVPNIRLENCPAENHIRVGWMRSVANVYHSFAINSFAGELAIAAGRDQKDYLLDLIGTDRILDEKVLVAQSVERFRNNELPMTPIEMPIVKGGKVNQVVAGFPPDTSRLRAVINQVAAESDWANKVAKYKGTRRGLGIAAHRSFLSYVAVVADVSLDDENVLTINDIYATIHCGLAVNRDRVLAQMEGGVVYGLSYALLGEITVKNGAVVQNNFDDYPVLRMSQTPRIHVSIVDSNDAPTGVGEPPTPAVAPALANAIAAAGGPRIQELPLAKPSVAEAKPLKTVVFVSVGTRPLALTRGGPRGSSGPKFATLAPMRPHCRSFRVR